MSLLKVDRMKAFVLIESFLAMFLFYLVFCVAVHLIALHLILSGSLFLSISRRRIKAFLD